MTTHHPGNERIKRAYFAYLREARRYSEASVDAVAKAIARFETHSRHKDFRRFHIEQAIAFKRHLKGARTARGEGQLSRATLHATLTALRNFFHWLAGQPGFRSRLSYADADYFNLPEKDVRAAKARRERPVPTLEQLHHCLDSMPARSEIERRDRAVMAVLMLTGARDGALASLSLKHVDLIQDALYQDGREVKTKFSKTFTTFFFPVGGQAREILADWVGHLRGERLWGNDDPLFPVTLRQPLPGGGFAAIGLERRHWSSADPVRRIFRTALVAAGLPDFNPHSVRNTLVQLGERVCRTPEEFKAWSQNLGHEKVMTTFSSYGAVASSRQRDLILGLRTGGDAQNDRERILAEIRKMVG